MLSNVTKSDRLGHHGEHDREGGGHPQGAGDGTVTPVFSDFEANRHDGERERNGGKANGKCKRDHHGIPFCDKDAPGPVNEKQTQALLLPSPPRRIAESPGAGRGRGFLFTRPAKWGLRTGD